MPNLKLFSLLFCITEFLTQQNQHLTSQESSNNRSNTTPTWSSVLIQELYELIDPAQIHNNQTIGQILVNYVESNNDSNLCVKEYEEQQLGRSPSYPSPSEDSFTNSSNSTDDFTLSRPLTSAEIYEQLTNLTTVYPLELVAAALNVHPNRLLLIIACFGKEINCIKSGSELPWLFSFEQCFLIALVCALFTASMLGNSFMLLALNPLGLRIIASCSSCFAAVATATNKKNKVTVSYGKELESKEKQQLKVSDEMTMVRVTDVFFCNAARFDLAWSLLVTPCQVAQILNSGGWPFNDISCRFYGYSTYFLLAVNSLTVMAIAIDRYCTIMITGDRRAHSNSSVNRKLCSFFSRPGSRSSTSAATASTRITWRTYACVAVIVIASGLLAVPYFVHTSKYFVLEGGDNTCWDVSERQMCLNMWSEGGGEAGAMVSENVFKIGFMLGIFVLPCACLCYCYATVACFLFGRGGRRSMDSGPHALQRTQATQRVVRVLILDCVFHALCWLPLAVWVLLACAGNLMRVGDAGIGGPSMERTVHSFLYLYLGPIACASLKWTFRLAGSWTRIKILINSSLHQHVAASSRLPSTTTATPAVYINDKKC